MTSEMCIDAHCHLANPQIEKNLDAIRERSIQAGISEWIQGGINPEDWNRQLRLKERFQEGIHLAFGMHPWWVAENSAETLEAGFEELKTRLHLAEWLGETGLDYLPKYVSQREKQTEYFEKQLELSQSIGKPVVLHIVHAHSDALMILKKWRVHRGIVHSFCEGKEVLKKYLDLGFLISIGPAVVKDGYRRVKEAIPFIPRDQLVLETDCPNARGTEPTQLLEIAQKVSELKGNMTGAELLSQSTQNLKKLLSQQMRPQIDGEKS